MGTIISRVVYRSIVVGAVDKIFERARNWSNGSNNTTDTNLSEGFRLMPHVI